MGIRKTLLSVGGFILFTFPAVASPGDINLDAGYFFPPPKHLFYYQPNYYIQRQTGYFGYRHRYFRPYQGYYPHSSLWISPARTNAVRKIYRMILAPPPTGGVVRVNSSDLIFDVNPPHALVYIDDRLIGSAGDFATERDRYSILDGEHDLRIEFPGYETYEARMDVVPDRTLHLGIELQPLPKE